MQVKQYIYLSLEWKLQRYCPSYSQHLLSISFVQLPRRSFFITYDWGETEYLPSVSGGEFHSYHRAPLNFWHAVYGKSGY